MTLYKSDFDPMIIVGDLLNTTQSLVFHPHQVETRNDSSSSLEVMDSPMDAGGATSRKRESGNIQEILTCGHISYNDLQLISALGHGITGTVHR